MLNANKNISMKIMTCYENNFDSYVGLKPNRVINVE